MAFGLAGKTPYGIFRLLISEEETMRYINAEDILPVKILEELRKYVEGEVIYVPKKDSTRAAWGEKNGVREEYKERNLRIYQNYRQGMCVGQLVNHYNLSESGIRKIIRAHTQKTIEK